MSTTVTARDISFFSFISWRVLEGFLEFGLQDAENLGNKLYKEG